MKVNAKLRERICTIIFDWPFFSDRVIAFHHKAAIKWVTFPLAKERQDKGWVREPKLNFWSYFVLYIFIKRSCYEHRGFSWFLWVRRLMPRGRENVMISKVHWCIIYVGIDSYKSKTANHSVKYYRKLSYFARTAFCKRSSREVKTGLNGAWKWQVVEVN